MSIVHYMAVIEKELDSDYCIYFPDLPGCVTAGVDQAEALAFAEEALQLHIDSLIEFGDPVPEPTTLAVEDIMAEPNTLGVAYVRARLPGRIRRVNITVDEDLLADIDAAAAARGYNRSGFVAEATRRLMQGGVAPRPARVPVVAEPTSARAPRPKAASSKDSPQNPAGVKVSSGRATGPKAKRRGGRVKTQKQ